MMNFKYGSLKEDQRSRNMQIQWKVALMLVGLPSTPPIILGFRAVQSNSCLHFIAQQASQLARDKKKKKSY